jgi:hypothetical protein
MSQRQIQAVHSATLHTAMLLLLQVRGEFRRFAVANYLSTYYMHTLNIETGLLGRPPPPGHWRQVAALLQARCAEAACTTLHYITLQYMLHSLRSGNPIQEWEPHSGEPHVGG